MRPARPPLPNLLLPGFPKCGTTSVAETLAAHPDVCGAFPHRATHFFTPRLYDPEAPLPAVGEYARHYSHARRENVRLDDTVVWAYGGERLVNAVRQTLGEPRILVMLREPTSRTVSYLTWKKRTVAIEQGLSLEEYVARCEELGLRTVDTEDLNPYSGLFGSEYSRFLPPWLEAFGDGIRVGFTDDLRDRPEEFYQRLAAWLDIDPVAIADSIRIANRASAVRSSTVEGVVRAVGRRVQPLARHAPRAYSSVRGLARALNTVEGTAVAPDKTLVATLQERFKPDIEATRRMVEGRELVGPPAWLSANP